MEISEAKAAVRTEIERLAPKLIEIAHSLHAKPELAFDEHHAHKVLTGAIADEGVEVERGAYGLSTAFHGRAGSSGPKVAICCEYDALPGIGHACGHNVIAAAGLGAGLAAASVAEDLGGRIDILGTPAEEGGGGKEFMLRRGAFGGTSAAMMVHPADCDIDKMQVLAVHRADVTYHGAASHASAAPQLGRNALDAAVLGYNAVAALRQHIAPEERIHGIFTDGGVKPNIVPARAATQWYVRSATQESLERLKARFISCIEGGATAACCETTYKWNDPAYSHMNHNEALLELYVANSAANGREVCCPNENTAVVGSTDMGNVSQVVPSIHPMIKVAPAGVAIHTPEFAEYAISDSADKAVVDGALNLAMTVVDCWANPEALRAIRADFALNQ